MAPLTPFTNAKGESYLNQYDFTPHAYIRTQPVQGWVQEAIANAVYSVDPELQIRVTSGGQPSNRDPSKRGTANGWTGSGRHNEGGAADFALVRNGEVLPISANKAIYQSVARNLAAQGVPGIGVDTNANFIHAGGGSEAAWGYQGKSNGARYLDPDFATSIQEGRTMAKSGGVPRPPGLVTTPPGSSVASLQDTRRAPIPAMPSPQISALRTPTPRLNYGQGPEGVGLMPPFKGVERFANGGDYGVKNPRTRSSAEINSTVAGLSLPRTANNAGDLLAMNPVSGGQQQPPMFDAAFDQRVNAMRPTRQPVNSQGIAVGSTPPAPVPAPVSDRVTARLNALPVLPALPTPRGGSSVLDDYAYNSRAAGRVPLPVPDIRVASLVPMALPTAGQVAGATGFRGAPNLMPPMPIPRPMMQPQQRRAPVPMPLAMRPAQQRAPLRIVVQRDQPVQQQPQPRPTPQGFSQSGNGSLTSDQYGSTYYSRHL